ncbi:MAG: pantoate--beta-alanine ligase, partial [Actinomycetia bacterium]|nr:pantoate--beta-alanine ligase [Actinomycetes bacterium]
CDKVFMTIFVNPTQFGPDEDFKKYPKDLAKDAALAKSAGVDYIFAPDAGQMYRAGSSTFVEVEGLSAPMCGKTRPGHFRGAATIVLKLFNIIGADRAYFGEKDYQQLAIIKKMVSDLDLDIEIIPGPTIREEDGLALSSRNKYLSRQERKNAPVIYRAIKQAKKMIEDGEEDLEMVKNRAARKIQETPHVKNIEYFDIRDAETLEEINTGTGNRDILIAAAVWLGGTRLIDNIVIKVKK